MPSKKIVTVIAGTLTVLCWIAVVFLGLASIGAAQGGNIPGWFNPVFVFALVGAIGGSFYLGNQG